jgi:hypothetical protein
MTRFLGLLFALGVTLLEAHAFAREPARFALLVGNNQPLDASTRTLRYADDDAVFTARLLREARVETRLLVTLDADSRRELGDVRAFGPARRAALERAFGELERAMKAARARGEIVEFLLFYSGHGDVDRGEGFVVLEDQKLSRSLLFSLLSRSPANKNHVFVDACRSYFVAFERGPGGERSPYAGVGFSAAVPAQLRNTGFVLSTTSDRDSHEWERYQGGILSHELRSALRGGADTNRDRRVSYAELGAFFTRANQSIESSRFRPEFLVRAPGGDFAHTILSWDKQPSLAFRARNWGHFYVENARGDRVLDVHPGSEQPLALFLPEERPLFVRKNDELAEYVLHDTAPRDVSELTATVPQLARRGAQSLALERLFALPFDERDVRAFVDTTPPSRARDAGNVATESEWSPLRRTSGMLTLVAASMGLAFNGAALYRYLGAGGKSQLETSRSNDQVSDLNRASLGFHAAAAIAGATFTFASFWPAGSTSVAPEASGGATLRVGGRF